MKAFQDLKIEGPSSQLQPFLDELVTTLEGWKVWSGSEDWVMPKTPGSNTVPYVAINTRQGLPPATLFLLTNRDTTACFVGNIVPDSGALSVEEYNRILQAFHADCVAAPAKARRLTVTLSPDEILLEDMLSRESMHLLRDFVANANKGVGSHTPFDYERWLAFIAANAKDKPPLNPELLRKWLIEQGFSYDVAMDMYREFKFGIDLIQRLEVTTPAADQVHAAR